MKTLYQINRKDKEYKHRTANRRLAQWRVTWLIEHSTSHQLLWCIDSFMLRNPPAVEFGRKHGVGKKVKDNGLIIMVSATLRETFITTGLGTEKILKDEICQEIVDANMVPEFKKGDYFEGISNGLEECILTWKKKE